MKNEPADIATDHRQKAQEESLNGRNPQRPYKLPFILDRSLSLPNIATLLILAFYVSGYLIHAVFVRSIAAGNISLLKADYIETGLVFIVLSLTITVSPLYLYYIITRTKEALVLPKAGSKRTVVATINLCLVLLLFATFVTKQEWNKMAYPILGNSISILSLFHVYVSAVLLVLVLINCGQRLHQSLTKDTHWLSLISKYSLLRFFDSHTETMFGLMRWILVVLTLVFDFVIICKLPWFWDLVAGSRCYFMMLLLTALVLYRVKLRLKELRHEKKLHDRLAALAGVFSLILFFLIIIAYAYGLYPLLPSNRGGRLPVCATIFLFSSEKGIFYDDILAPRDNSTTSTVPPKVVRTVPLGIVDQTEDEFFVVRAGESPLEAKCVYGVKKSNIEACQSTEFDTADRCRRSSRWFKGNKHTTSDQNSTHSSTDTHEK